MHVLVTGGTGFVGRALLLRLRREGHSVTVVTRSPSKARTLLGREASLLDVNAGEAAYDAAVDSADAVVNLAGEPLLGGRWTEEKKRRLRRSRVDLTDTLVRRIGRSVSPPAALVSASAVGYYGDRGEELLTEASSPGEGFLADLCHDWEAAALAAASHGVRVVTPRLGVVLGRADGALDKMLPAFRLGLGGRVGTGDQYLPWIHIDDLANLLVDMIQGDRFEGAYNATAPTPERFRDFAEALGDELSRPTIVPVPAFAVKAAFGEAAETLLASQQAIPERAEAAGFAFRFPRLDAALGDILDVSDVEIRPFEGPRPESTYLVGKSPKYELRASTTLERPVEDVFEFFSRPENLGLITPPGMQFAMGATSGEVAAGALLEHTLRVGPVPISWTSLIEVWDPVSRFVDVQKKGPYACWWHEHVFREVPGGTEMTDRVLYSPPAGLVGKLANSVFIAGRLREVFSYRAAVMRRRFG